MPETGTVPDVLVRLRVPDAAAMRRLGSRLAAVLEAGDLVVLAGSLGAGKTTLVQGIGAGLDVRGQVTSPTFVIARVHRSLRGGPDLVHADAYRLGSRIEVDDLDLDADTGHAVTVVEWGEGLVEDLTAAHLLVSIEWAGPEAAGHPEAGPRPVTDPGPGTGNHADELADEPRSVTVAGYGSRWRAAADRLRAAL